MIDRKWIGQQRPSPGLPRQVDHLAAVRTAVDQIAQQNEPVLPLQMEFVEQIGELPVAAMDVSNGDKASGHRNLLALT